MTNQLVRNGRIAAGLWLGLVLALVLWPAGGPANSFAQEPGDAAAAPEDAAGPTAVPADASVEDDAADAGEAAAAGDAPADSEVLEGPEEGRLSLIWLILQGGYLMIPIGLMSLLVAMFGIERFIGLRRERIMPQGLVEGLSQQSTSAGVLDPTKAYRLCQRFPSTAATVIKAMLRKVGRPHREVEHAVGEASEREAARLYANVRWLTLAAGISPLMGLLGTVWGMIQAFFQTTQLQAGQNKADFLAQGIYVALVTTLGGLAVAIPAAILAHYFEGRIQSLFHETDEMMVNLMEQVEGYEGRVRVSRQSMAGAPGPERSAQAAPENAEPAPATVSK